MSESTKPPTSDAPEKERASEGWRAGSDALPPRSTQDVLTGPRADLARAIPRRPRVTWWLGILLAAVFAMFVIPSITAERWLRGFGMSEITEQKPAPVTVRVPPFAGTDTAVGRTGGGGVLIARGETPDRDTASDARDIENRRPHGPVPYIAFLLLVGVLGGLFTHHTRRSTQGRLLRVQLANLAIIVIVAVVVKIVMLTTALSVLIVPVALFAMVPTLVLDRIVGLATGTLAALVVSMLVPFDVGVAVMLMVQAGAAGLVIAERPKKRVRATLIAGIAATIFTAATYPLMLYLTAGRLPLEELSHPLQSAWVAAATGPAIATGLALVLVPLYQLLVGEITQGELVELEDLSNPLLKQIAEKAPGTWQHSLTMANMAEIAANAIGANGRLVRVGAYYHDLGKSLQPKYFIENLEPGETSPHDRLPPEVSCDAIFAHVTEGIVTARKAGLHERIVDFMHMHHGNGVLEYFWAKSREQNKGLTVEHFRYPGVPPQSRETAILSICDAVEAAARTLKKPEVQAIDNLVQRIVYGKLHLGQLDESGLSMEDLRRMAESLRETIRHANHNRIEYPWQKAQQDASASGDQQKLTQTGPRLDSLDQPARPESVHAAAPSRAEDSLADTDSAGATPKLRPQPRDSSELALKTTAPVMRPNMGPDASAARTREDPSMARDAAVAQTWKADAAALGKNLSAEISLPKENLDVDVDLVRGRRPKEAFADDDVVELRSSKPKADDSYDKLPPMMPRLGELVSTTTPPPVEPQESDPRMRRVTNPVEERFPSPEAAQFVTDAKHALDEASKNHPALPADAIDPARQPSLARSISGPVQDAPSAARKRAATLPPLRPPTMPPPIGRRSPTMPDMLRAPALPGMRPRSNSPAPLPGMRPPTNPPAVTAPPPASLRPPATQSGDTTPPPSVLRTPGQNLLDDMITLRPQHELRPEFVVNEDEDGSVHISPSKVVGAAKKMAADDAAVTRPMQASEEEPDESLRTQPRRAVSDSDVTRPSIDLPGAPGPETSWARGLSARLDRQLQDDFGTDTPISAPTRAELQALLDAPPDVTREQSLDEIEALHRVTMRERERKEQDLDFTRRTPYPTAEVDEADIESAIELAPPARGRNVIGVAKKKPQE